MAEIAGLKLIVPTSVAGSGVSVSASGKVTFTAATSISINGCFSATYNNYLIVMRHLHSLGGRTILARLRLSGTDESGTNYTAQTIYASGSTVQASRFTSETAARSGTTSQEQRSGDHIYVYGPNLAQPTVFRNVNACGISNAYLQDNAATHSLSTAYDGITLYVADGSLTGALTIYGLSQ